MKIDYGSVDAYTPSLALEGGKIVSLAQRIMLQGKEGGVGADPEFDQFYTSFMEWVSAPTVPPSGGIHGYLKQYANTDGDRVYNTSKKQMDVLTQIMLRMKEQGLETGQIYKDVKAALVSVSANNMFVQEFMQDVFKPSDDEDDRENSSW